MKRGLLLLALGSLLSAQALRQERRTYARVLELRAELAAALEQAPAERRAAVVAALDGDEDPMRRTARALALASGIEPDPDWLRRAGFQAFALPEVLDPQVPLPGKNETGIHLTAHTPFKVSFDAPASLRFELLGPAVVEVPLAEPFGSDDLGGFRASTLVPAARLAPGAWQARLSVMLGEREPREHDLIATAPFVVHAGFVAARNRMIDEFAAIAPKLTAWDRAAALGALAPIERVYQGEPPQGRSRILADLANAERVLRNCSGGHAVHAGLSGWIASAVPIGEDRVLLCALRRMAEHAEGADQLVLFVPGVPSWDGSSTRPGGLEVLDPWPVVDALERARFDGAGRCHLAVLESPGRVPAPGPALVQALAALREHLRVERVVLVAEREAATVACLALDELARHLAGLVLVTGGGLGPRELAAHASLPILAIPAASHAMSVNLLRMPLAAGDGAAQLELLPPDGRPWPVALELELARVERFALDR